MMERYRVQPQILIGMLMITFLAVTVILATPEYTDKIAGSAITALGMLCMKVLEKR